MDKKIVRSEVTRPSSNEKIKAAMAKKPTASILRGMSAEELNKIIIPGKRQMAGVTKKVFRNLRTHKKIRPKVIERSLFSIDPFNKEPLYEPDSILYPTPDWFNSPDKPVVSIIIPLYRSTNVIQDQIDSWDFDDGITKEIIYVDDCCPNDSKGAVVPGWEKRGVRLPIGKIVILMQNSGYGMACNVGAKYASGEYLIFLNADTKVTPGWIKPMIDLLKDSRVGIVGNMHIKEGGEWHGRIDSAGSEWDWRGNTFTHIGRNILNGSVLPAPLYPNDMPEKLKVVGEREMVTGCCFAIRKSLFNKIDGFDSNYRIGYWEDSDICCTVKELGYKILYQPESVIWHKLSHSGAGGHMYYWANTEFFRNKWIYTGRIDKLVTTPRPFSMPKIETVLIKRNGANGDVLLASSVLPALKKKWPSAKITFHTSCHQVLQGNPHIDRILTHSDSYHINQFQVVINLDNAYEYHPNWSITKAYAWAAGVSEEDCQAYIHTKPLSFDLPSKYIVVHAKHIEGFGWVGRNWKGNRFSEVSQRLRDEGHKVICVGAGTDWGVSCDLDLRGKLNIHELATVMKHASFFIGVDSFPMHIAQIFKIPGVVFFGSILPEHRLISGGLLHPIQATNLSCLGCHHRKKPPCLGTSECERHDSACEDMVTVDMFLTKVKQVMESRFTLKTLK